MRETVMLLVALALICFSLTIISELLQNKVLSIVLSFITISIFIVLIMIDIQQL